MLTDFDLHLLGEGRHWTAYEKLGAHVETHDGVRGVRFAVWAPNAAGVSVVGDFNGWNGDAHRMHKRIPSGVWELFVPGLDVGTLYKFRVQAADGASDRSDPYGFGAEVPPRTASVVVDLGAYQWHDAEWMASRAARQSLSAPLSIYEVHLGSWRRPGDDPHRWLSYADLERELEAICVETGRSLGDIVRGALRRQLQRIRFERLAHRPTGLGQRLRAQGMRPIQIWVSDAHSPPRHGAVAVGGAELRGGRHPGLHRFGRRVA
jgi:hypothetical protein